MDFGEISGGVRMRICGYNKTTLLDYPEHVAATVFVGGCNFRCPFCQNSDLVLRPEVQPAIRETEILGFLEKRKGILTGVCLTGGEPTLAVGLGEFIRKVKEMGYLVKLDTNGYRPEILRGLLSAHLLDYIAMDVKNSMERYGETVGDASVDTGRIRESVHIIMESGISYEFRTTVVKELHGEKEITAIGREIEGADKYFLQSYRDSEGVMEAGFHACERNELERFAECVRPYVGGAWLRGVD